MKAQLDPLYVIFEQHLFNFQDPEIDRQTLISKIVNEYLTFLRRKNLTVPKSMEQPIVEELSRQVNSMLVKKIYGCLTLDEFRSKTLATEGRKARGRYKKMTA